MQFALAMTVATLECEFFLVVVKNVIKKRENGERIKYVLAGRVCQTNGVQVTDSNMYQVQYTILFLRKCLFMGKWPQA